MSFSSKLTDNHLIVHYHGDKESKLFISNLMEYIFLENNHRAYAKHSNYTRDISDR